MPARYYWDRGNIRRPYDGPTVPLTIELGSRVYASLQVERRDCWHDLDRQLELWRSYETERERSLAKRLAELEALEAEIMGELVDA